MGGTLEADVNVSLAANRRIYIAPDAGTATFKAATGTTMTINDQIYGAGNVVFTGGGTVGLYGNNSYGGTTTVNGNTTLNVLSSGILPAGQPVTVTGGSTLGGTGTIGGPTTIQDGGTLAPGASPGTLTLNSAPAFSPLAELSFELKGDDMTVGGGVNDLLIVGRPLTLDGILNVAEIGAGSFLSANNGDTWRLFNYTGSLTDNGLSLGAMPALSSGLYFAIDSSTPNQVNLRVVPEPSTLTLGMLGVLLLGVINSARRCRTAGQTRNIWLKSNAQP